MKTTVNTDVLIVGGGPVGLLISYSLARQGVASIVVAQHDKEQQAMYGRATTLYPRTLEMLDQLGLLEELNQIGYIGRNSVTYKDGRRVTSRGWHIMFERMNGTFRDYCLNIRQKYSEDVIRTAYLEQGGEAYIGWKLEGYAVEDVANDGYNVTSQIRQWSTDKTVTVKSKFIVGADGSHSLVRRSANIPFEGDHTQFKWVRIDGIFSTNMPDADVGFASIESKSHGNVLWVQLDHGVKRIGFAMTDEMLAKYGEKLTQEQAIEEARKSMEPFTFEVQKVEWWTLYSINPKVADTFYTNSRVLLAGDACHTHSSGATQGMNTGVHDAVNLSWKLGGVVKGWYSTEILHTYDLERRPAAQHLIELDKAFSATISGQIPDSHKGAYVDANELFTRLFDETIQFNIGLGIHYDETIINKSPSTGMISAGWRGPDALLYAPGSRIPVRLFQLIPNYGKWSVIVLAGQPLATREKLGKAVEQLSRLRDSLPCGLAHFLTILAQSPAEGDQMFATPKIGKMYYDQERSAHAAYSISTMEGAVVALRPDGIMGHAANLDNIESIESFLKEVILTH
ncbi:pentachlorophenol 4-monooxygenase [Aspergillus eucalypticola CBS 122712]|uniref:Pentachlorophenol 4-monooxygenase n=1 Tax=Aspergillus eucalypticola (strain CBS 122712 / IBT 29274) TaxID=1448314 RepID=A0A317UNH0_ASPEC|nr:pentachlorophenol 4-monooxygenase [Aspergillus eucalypticola CBS 122712]PWY63045.1 pentachlorophenol 4-monooxygenase [Aspergillus eucalypticola CBS 122712]